MPRLQRAHDSRDCAADRQEHPQCSEEGPQVRTVVDGAGEHRRTTVEQLRRGAHHAVDALDSRHAETVGAVDVLA